MKQTILVTGSSGLVGRRLCTALAFQKVTVRGFDLKAVGAELGDIRKPEQIRAAIDGCVGIVHLAAVSRVVWGQKNPVRCWDTNVGGLHHLLEAASSQVRKPWILFASSREVYGQPERLPADETTPLNPVNVYARSKVEGERLTFMARKRGIQTAVIRLSNVFGCTRDHPDRVVPAFARAASTGEVLRVDGNDHTFDFTHVDDVVRGICSVIGVLQARNRSLPPVQFVTGRPTTLRQLAEITTRLAESNSLVVEAPPRSFDVAHFYGDPSRALSLLGWSSRIALEEGLSRLISAYRSEHERLNPTGIHA